MLIDARNRTPFIRNRGRLRPPPRIACRTCYINNNRPMQATPLMMQRQVHDEGLPNSRPARRVHTTIIIIVLYSKLPFLCSKRAVSGHDGHVPGEMGGLPAGRIFRVPRAHRAVTAHAGCNVRARCATDWWGDPSPVRAPAKRGLRISHDPQPPGIELPMDVRPPI